MNWYKIAALNITPKEFQTKHYQELIDIARNTSITPQTQLLFFTEKYKHKNWVLQYLSYNTSISSQTQSMFFTQEYVGKNSILWTLAENTSITPQTKLLFFTQEYGDKHHVLKFILRNRNIFLKGLTPKELREFAKAKEARLPVYRKRFQDVKAMVLL